MNLKPGAIMALGLFMLPVIGLALVGRPMIACLLLPVPFVLYLCTSPRTAFYLFLVTIGFYLPYLIGTFALWPFDVAMALLCVAIMIDFLLHQRTEIRRTAYDLPFFFLIGATWLSALFAFDHAKAIVPSVRILAIYVAFRAVFTMSAEIGVRRVVQFYMWQVFALSLINLVLFLMAGGRERIFGPAWLVFENFSMTATPMALAFFIWSRTTRERMLYAMMAIVIVLAVAASGSRGSLLAIALAVPILVLVARAKAAREENPSARRAAGRIVAIVAVSAVLVLVLGTALFGGFLERVGELGASLTKPQGTVALRLVLWKAALKGFLTSPMVGIGIGNYTSIDQVVPAIKAEPVWYYIRGMSAHNVVLHYLAETGLVGASALLTLAAAGFIQARRQFRVRRNRRDSQVSAALYIMMVVFCLSIFFMRAWTWSQEGYVLALIFGLSAAWSLTPPSNAASDE
jgi:O-antigen ligase